jgi:hypothetical protein
MKINAASDEARMVVTFVVGARDPTLGVYRKARERTGVKEGTLKMTKVGP